MKQSRSETTSSLLDHVTHEVQRVLADQRLIVDADIWSRHREDDGFVRAILDGAYGGSQDWDGQQVAGRPAMAHVRAVNDAVHCVERSTGAAQLKKQVAAEQGGTYCRMCGSLGDLEVDHIVAVSRGGAKSALKNLQLLCKRCNAAKRELDAELLPAALATNKTRRVPAKLRFKRLLLTADLADARPLGRCDCGATAQQQQLSVEPVAHMAANLLSLVVTCQKCRGPAS